MIDDALLDQVEDEVARCLYQLNSGDEQEAALRQSHPNARYRDPHPVFDLTRSLLKWAVLSGAQGVVLAPQELEMELLFDHQGRQEQAAILPLKLHNALTARIKDMASLDVDAQDCEQTGSFPAVHDEQSYEMTVLVIPTPHGEQVVLRFLTRTNTP
jgi:type II secretory ATPase GspE/PulE/Tfp pilus assembly ATPase PilB-like protein